MFYNSHLSLLGIVDDANRIHLLDAETLAIYTGIWVGKKVQLTRASTFIYVYTDRYLNIYNWNLGLVEKIELGLSYMPTNIVEFVNKLAITDAYGRMYEVNP